MRKQEKIEREIDLRELFWSILFGWRQIICFSIVMAVLFSGMKYIFDNRAYQSAQMNDGKKSEPVLTAEAEEQLSSAREMIARIKEYQEYLDTSPLMQLNPYEKRTIELQYYVKSDYTYDYTKENQNDYTGTLMTFYYNFITGGELRKNIISTLNLSISQADLSELWTISQVGNSISIKIAYPEEEKLKDMAEFVKQQLEQKELEFQQIGSHELKLMDESQNIIVDTALIDKRNAISNNIASINTQLTVLKTNMSEQLRSLLYNEDMLNNDSGEEVAVKPGFRKKNFLLGAFLGFFLVCVWIVCKRLFTVRLQSSEEICSLYNARLLGSITIKSQKRHFLSVIDNTFLAVKNRRKKKLSVEQQIMRIVTNVVLSCKKEGREKVYMTGSEYESADMPTLDKIKKELVEQGVQVKEGGNIFYDAESLKQATEIGTILFIEQTGKSIYDEIYNELNLAKEQGNQILGVVVLES